MVLCKHADGLSHANHLRCCCLLACSQQNDALAELADHGGFVTVVAKVVRTNARLEAELAELK